MLAGVDFNSRTEFNFLNDWEQIALGIFYIICERPRSSVMLRILLLNYEMFIYNRYSCYRL